MAYPESKPGVRLTRSQPVEPPTTVAAEVEEGLRRQAARSDYRWAVLIVVQPAGWRFTCG